MVVPPWVKTFQSLGVKIVETYMKKAKLQDKLDQLGLILLVTGVQPVLEICPLEKN